MEKYRGVHICKKWNKYYIHRYKRVGYRNGNTVSCVYVMRKLQIRTILGWFHTKLRL